MIKIEMELRARLILIAGFILFCSCESIPPVSPPSSWFSILPANASLYACVNDCGRFGFVFKDLFEKNGINPAGLDELLKRTERAFFSLDSSMPEKKNMNGLFVGRYSSFSISAGFSSSSDWIKKDGKYAYWKNKITSFSVSNPLGYLLLATGGDITDDLARVDTRNGYRIPDDISLRISRSVAAFYIPQFSPEILPVNVPFNKEKIPLADILLLIQKEENGFSIDATFSLGAAGDRKIFITSLKTFIVWIARSSGVSDFVRRTVITENDSGIKTLFAPCTIDEVEKMSKIFLSEFAVEH
jgi:hypothetical protein